MFIVGLRTIQHFRSAIAPNCPVFFELSTLNPETIAQPHLHVWLINVKERIFMANYHFFPKPAPCNFF